MVVGQEFDNPVDYWPHLGRLYPGKDIRTDGIRTQGIRNRWYSKTDGIRMCRSTGTCPDVQTCFCPQEMVLHSSGPGMHAAIVGAMV